MAFLKYEDLTHTELAGLERSRTVVLISVSPLEEHAPHLPLGNDIYLAKHFSELISKKLSEKNKEWNFLFLPPLFIGADALNYVGSISTSPQLLRSILYTQCKQLARDGFKTMMTFSGHAGPRHIVVLEELASKMKWRHGVRMLSATSRIVTEGVREGFKDKLKLKLEEMGSQMSEEEFKAVRGDMHAGMVETSLMLVIRPDLVRPIYKTLKPAPTTHPLRITPNSGKKLGEGLGHIGYPHLARKEIGEAVIQVVLDDVLPLMEKFLKGESVERKFRSPLYYIPIFRTDAKWVLILAAYLVVFISLWKLANLYLYRL